MSAPDYEVAISGGGPVGMGLAIDLGQRGIRTVVIERHPTPQPVPKGQNLTQRTMEHIAAWGCETELRAARVTPRDVASGGLVTYGTILSDWAYDWLPRERVAQFYDRAVERLPQYATEAVLRARAATVEGIDILYDHTVRTARQSADAVEIDVEGRDGSARTITARYAVGCDGARSALRAAAGLPETRSDHDRRMVLLVFRSTGLHDLLAAQHPTRAFYNALRPGLEGYWLFLGRVDLGSEWFLHAPVPPEATGDDFDFTAFVHDAVGRPFEMEITYTGFWDLRVATADSYRAGRVFIAGDAAHSHPPYGGYGINTGFEDARNLGWKLAETLGGRGGDFLLDSYEAERRPVFLSTARDFIERFIADDRAFLAAHRPGESGFAEAWQARNEGDSEVMAFEPNYEGSPIIEPGDPDAHPSARGSHAVAARSGHHLTPQDLSDGTGVYRRLGSGFTLLAFDADPSAFEDAARDRDLPLAIVRDPDGPAAAYGAHLILVRPDHFVAWIGDAADAATAATVLARSFGTELGRKGDARPMTDGYATGLSICRIAPGGALGDRAEAARTAARQTVKLANAIGVEIEAEDER